MRWIWRWLRPRREVQVSDSGAAVAEAVARQKLAEAQARRPETRRAVNQFAALVEAELARRQHR